jgi:hypothetical protein
MFKRLEAIHAGQPAIDDQDELNAAVARIPTKPDENLR